MSSCPLCPPGDAEGAGRPVVVLLLFFTRVLPRVWASAASTNLGQDPPEIAYWERGDGGWLAGDPKPWQPEAVTVASDRLVAKP